MIHILVFSNLPDCWWIRLLVSPSCCWYSSIFLLISLFFSSFFLLVSFHLDCSYLLRLWFDAKQIFFLSTLKCLKKCLNQFITYIFWSGFLFIICYIDFIHSLLFLMLYILLKQLTLNFKRFWVSKTPHIPVVESQICVSYHKTNRSSESHMKSKRHKIHTLKT